MNTAFPWFELVTDDPDRDAAALAEAVDGEVVGSAAYRAVARQGMTLFGILPSGETGTSPHWIAHIGTSDVEAFVRRARFLQSDVLEEVSGDEDGHTALIADPGGAMIAPTDTTMSEGVPFAALLAPRTDLAVRVYRSLCDWKEGDTLDDVVTLKARSRRVAMVVPTEAAEVQWVPCVVAPAPSDPLHAVIVRGVGTVHLACTPEGVWWGSIISADSD